MSRYSLCFSNQTDQGDARRRVLRGTDTDGEIGKGQIGEGECE